MNTHRKGARLAGRIIRRVADWAQERRREAGEEGGPDAYARHVREGCRRAGELAAQIDAVGVEVVLPRIRKAWIETELPSRCPDAWSRIWDAVGSVPAPSRVMGSKERQQYAKLPPRLAVFRGAGAGGERGWSWTLDRSVAEDFAVRYEGTGEGSDDPRLCVAEVDRAAVLAYFQLGDEHEVIIDPLRIDWTQVTVETVTT